MFTGKNKKATLKAQVPAWLAKMLTDVVGRDRAKADAIVEQALHEYFIKHHHPLLTDYTKFTPPRAPFQRPARAND